MNHVETWFNLNIASGIFDEDVERRVFVATDAPAILEKLKKDRILNCTSIKLI